MEKEIIYIQYNWHFTEDGDNYYSASINDNITQKIVEIVENKVYDIYFSDRIDRIFNPNVITYKK